MYLWKWLIVMMSVVATAGCGTRPVAGGTQGTLKVGGEPMCDLQITVHQVVNGNMDPIGFGVTTADGTFLLYKTGATSGLWLEPGEYRLTLESVGAPTVIDKEYRKPETTPWKVQWSGDLMSLDLELPASEPDRQR